MRVYPYWRVAGREFSSYKEAHLYAQQYTLESKQRIALTETPDAYSPSYVLNYYQNGEVTA